jgi:autotransporter-associated beta strand protein
MKPMKSPANSFLRHTAAVAIACTASACAGNLAWDAGINSNWNTADANWSSDIWDNSVPDSAIFGAAGVGTVTLTTGINVQNITFNTAGYTVSGNTLTLNNTTVTANQDATISSSFVNGGTNSLIKEGSGTLTLTGANSYNGNTTINAGTLKIAEGASIYNGGYNNSAVLAVNNGATLELNRWGYGLGGANQSLGGLDYNPARFIINGGTVKYTGGAAGAPTDPAEAPYGPGFTIGALGAILDAAKVSDTWTVKNDSRGYGPITSNDGGTLTLTGIGNGIFDKQLGGTGGVVMAGADRWTLNRINSYSGGTIVNSGTLELNSTSFDESVIRGTLTVNTGATVNITGYDYAGLGRINGANVSALTVNGGTVNNSVISWMTGAAVNLTGATMNGTGSHHIISSTLNSKASASTSTISNALLLRKDYGSADLSIDVENGAAATDLLITGSIGQAGPAGGIAKTGPGTLVLTGGNTYAGATSVNGGILQLGDGTSGNDGTVANTSGISIASGASLVFNRFGNLTSGVAISGAGSVVKTGPGTQTLTGPNSYSGGTTVSGGTLVVESAATLGSGNVTVNAGASCEIRNPAGAIADVASVHLNGTGQLVIASGVTEVVSGLYIDGVPQEAGSYDASSLASHISGGGSLNVVEGTVLVSSPLPRQVIQRNGGNTGAIVITGTYSGTPESIEARAVVMVGSGNNGTSTDWMMIDADPTAGTFSGTLSGVAAGGWYQIEVRSVSDGNPLSNTAIVQRVGVGDIYVTAGQSNSCNWGEPGINTDDRVSAMNFTNGAWSMAADPMPGGDGPRGSVWTRLGPLLTSASNLPVGFVSVGVGGTAVSYWVPPSTDGYLRLKAAAQAFPPNGFRAVLWHQGESDSYYSTTPADYQTRLSSAITQLRTDAGWAMPWYVAEASDLSNTTLMQEEPVMAGQRRVIYADPLVFAGPATDDFHLEGKLYDGVHFNNAGMADHAQQWADVLAGTAPPAPKNGDIESNPALADGGIAVVNMGDVSSSSVIGWHILNASGEAVPDGGNGYFNPDALFYAGAVDSGASGGVLPNMSGRHVAFLYAGSDGNHFLQTRRATLQPNTTYALTVALGVRSNGGIYGNARIELLADGAVIASREVTLADLNALNGGNAANTFTDAQLTCNTGATVTAGQQLAIRITKIIGMSGGNPTYLDFDKVRLTAAPNNDFTAWISNPAFGLSAGDQGFDADPDGDHLTNGVEAWFGTHPGESNAGIIGITGDGATTTFTHPQNTNPPDNISGSYRWSPDLVSWYSADGLDGPPGGATVTATPITAGTTTTVTATSSSPLPRLFLRAEVSLAP